MPTPTVPSTASLGYFNVYYGKLQTKALQLLNSSGARKELVAQLKSQPERSPDSIPALQKLIEYY